MVSFYSIPLLKDLGFYYCKVIPSSLIPSSKTSMEVSIVYILNFHSDVLLKKDVSFLDKLDLISTPYIVTKVLNRGKNRWYKLGSRDLKEEECYVPDFKYDDIRFYNGKFDKNVDKFKVISNLYATDFSKKKYDEVKDLGLWLHYSGTFVQEKLSIMQAKLQNIDEDVLFEDLKDDYGFKLASRHVQLGL